MTRLVACVGPESSGKSTLAVALGRSLNAVVVPELARALLTPALQEGLESTPGYDLDVVESIGRQQLAAERSALAAGHDRVILDTDLVVIAVWCDVRFGRVPIWIAEELDRAYPRHWLLLEPDLPWEPDPLRENPDDRPALFTRYQSLLASLMDREHGKHRFSIIGGSDRLGAALAAIRGA